MTSYYNLQVVSSFTYSVKWQKRKMDRGNGIENRADRYWSFNPSKKKPPSEGDKAIWGLKKGQDSTKKRHKKGNRCY